MNSEILKIWIDRERLFFMLNVSDEDEASLWNNILFNRGTTLILLTMVHYKN